MEGVECSPDMDDAMLLIWGIHLGLTFTGKTAVRPDT